MSKTLYEQFKEDYRMSGKSSVKRSKQEFAKQLVKQSYLNAIDCMIERILTPKTLHGSKYYVNGYSDALDNEVELLQEQRNLIENHE